MKKNKAPGPDEVYSDLLKLPGEEMLKAIHSLFQKSWRDGKVPDRWREAEVKFLRKQGKKYYREPGSYRHISLTRVLCKCMERIFAHRLYGLVEHCKLLDKEQEGFRRFRGTCVALLRLTQDIHDDFNRKEHTAAVFIDLEKAYDSVWREGLLVKLARKGFVNAFGVGFKVLSQTERLLSIYRVTRSRSLVHILVFLRVQYYLNYYSIFT